jgi:hypothetical protein
LSTAAAEPGASLRRRAPPLRGRVDDHPAAQQRIGHRVGVDLIFTCAHPLLELVESHVQPLKVVASSSQFSAASVTTISVDLTDWTGVQVRKMNQF